MKPCLTLVAAALLSACATNAATVPSAGSNTGAEAAVPLSNAYVVNFRNFSRSEVFALTDALETTFPAQLHIESISGPAENRLVNVLTPAAGHRLEAFLHSSLTGMGIAESSVAITIRSDNRVIVDRVSGLPNSRDAQPYSYN